MLMRSQAVSTPEDCRVTARALELQSQGCWKNFSWTSRFFKPSHKDKKFAFITVEQMNGWPIAWAVGILNSDVVIKFVKKEIIEPPGPSGKIFQDNESAFMAATARNLLETNRIE